MRNDYPIVKDLVLIGGGHAHALVLRMWAMQPLAGVRVTVINPGPVAPYTGMLPGHIAGHYSSDEIMIDLVRLARWQDKRLWRVPLLWSLHLAYAWLAVACLGMAAWNFGWLASPSPATHALNVGAMGGLILAMIARVSLGHTGRPLQPPRAMIAAFILLQLGTLARVLLVEFWPVGSLHLAATCWAIAFGLFVIFYAPMLCRTRADGHPG